MKPATALRLRRLPLPPLRDLAVKQPSTGPNIASLDGIRGVALLAVVAGHARMETMSGHAAVGVWIFFVLSAFLLTLPFAVHPERLREPRRWLHYFARRALRILPPYYLFLPLFGVFMGQTPTRVLQHALFLVGDVHLWSIPQEVLFYAILPPLLLCNALLFAGGRGGGRSVLALLALAVAASLWLGPEWISLEAAGRPSRFFLGVFVLGVATCFAHRWAPLARWVQHPLRNRVLHGAGFAAIALVLLSSPFFVARWSETLRELWPAFAMPTAPLAWLYPGFYGALGAVLLYATLHCPERALGRIMSSLPLRALGLVSYSAYLVHIPVLWTLRAMGLPDGVLLFALGLLVTYLIAALSYTFVERPFLSIRVA